MRRAPGLLAVPSLVTRLLTAQAPARERASLRRVTSFMTDGADNGLASMTHANGKVGDGQGGRDGLD